MDELHDRVSGSLLLHHYSAAGAQAYLILCRDRPVGELVWIRDTLLEAVGTERAKPNGRGAKHGARLPEESAAHCVTILRGIFGFGVW